MSVRMRHTHSQTRQRRSHHALVATQLVKDKETGVVSRSHRVDEVTGMYRGKQVASPKKVKAEKKQHDHKGHDHSKHVELDEKKPVEAKQVALGAKVPATRPRAMGGGAGK